MALLREATETTRHREDLPSAGGGLSQKQSISVYLKTRLKVVNFGLEPNLIINEIAHPKRYRKPEYFYGMRCAFSEGKNSFASLARYPVPTFFLKKGLNNAANFP